MQKNVQAFFQRSLPAASGLAVLLVLLTGGCGQRGPLYLPNDGQPDAQQMVVPASAPAVPAGADSSLEDELETEDDLQDGNLEDDSPGDESWNRPEDDSW